MVMLALGGSCFVASGGSSGGVPGVLNNKKAADSVALEGITMRLAGVVTSGS